MPTGYSGKTLVDKLGVKTGTMVQAVNPPPDYAALLGPLPEGAGITAHSDCARLKMVLHGEKAEFIHCFVSSLFELAAAAPDLAASLAPGGALWLSWPKLAAAKRLGLPGDVREQSLRDALLPLGLVDVKVCAVDATWSGLLFRWRKP